MLAYILFRQNSPVPSLSEYTRAARLRVPTAQQLSTVALDYVLAGDYADADKWMTKVTVMTPTDSEAWYSLGRIKYTENRFQEAIDCFTRSLVLSPHSVKAENNLGLAEEGLNQVDAAVTAYQTAITWQADVPSPSEQPLVNLGLVLIDRNELEEALPLLRQAEKIAPEDARIRAALGRLYQKQGQLPQAQAELERAVALAPKTAAYHFLLGQVYHRAGMGEQAKSEFSQAAAIGGSGSSR
jgi:tetratricopeptide (TPR) repeat protein